MGAPFFCGISFLPRGLASPLGEAVAVRRLMRWHIACRGWVIAVTVGGGLILRFGVDGAGGVRALPLP